jgi:hypothetical protein
MWFPTGGLAGWDVEMPFGPQLALLRTRGKKKYSWQGRAEVGTASRSKVRDHVPCHDTYDIQGEAGRTRVPAVVQPQGNDPTARNKQDTHLSRHWEGRFRNPQVQLHLA